MEDALENLYQETAEDKLEGITKITTLLTTNNTSTTIHLDDVVENDQLMGAFILGIITSSDRIDIWYWKDIPCNIIT